MLNADLSIWYFVIGLALAILCVKFYLTRRIKQNHLHNLSPFDKTKWQGPDIFGIRRVHVSFWVLSLSIISGLAYIWKTEEVFDDWEDLQLERHEQLLLKRGEIIPEQTKFVEPVKEKTEKPKQKPEKIKLTDKPVVEKKEDASNQKQETEQTEQFQGQKGSSDEEILKFVHQFPLFPGCDEGDMDYVARKKCADMKLKNFIQNNLKFPSQAMSKGTFGTVLIAFVVEKNGKVSDIKIVRDIGDGCGLEAKRVVEMMNHMGAYWTPGMQSGRPVRVQYTLPVEFKGR